MSTPCLVMSSHHFSYSTSLSHYHRMSCQKWKRIKSNLDNECQELARINHTKWINGIIRRSAPSTKYLPGNASKLPRGLRQQCTVVGGFKKCNHFRNALATFSDPPSKAVVVMKDLKTCAIAPEAWAGKQMLSTFFSHCLVNNVRITVSPSSENRYCPGCTGEQHQQFTISSRIPERCLKMEVRISCWGATGREGMFHFKKRNGWVHFFSLGKCSIPIQKSCRRK